MILLYILYKTHLFLYSSEVMDYTGVLDDIKIGGEAQATMNALKKKTLKTVNGFKSTIRRRLAPNGIKNTIEAAATKEKLATFGFAAGAFVGFML
mmetsp:Transcript_78/g.119  ORF Transcript_78/g.119 Transcript_78/m.119 type:complete len:95 (+) Transcript_78:379-663(+)